MARTLSPEERARAERELAKMLQGPDFSQMKCEHPSPDTVLAKDDEQAKAIYSGLNFPTTIA